jgi:hypothetical protein
MTVTTVTSDRNNLGLSAFDTPRISLIQHSKFTDDSERFSILYVEAPSNLQTAQESVGKEDSLHATC